MSKRDWTRDWDRSKRLWIFTLTYNNFCIWTPILQFETTIFVNLQLLTGRCEPTIKNGCEVGSGHVPLKHLLTYYYIDDSDQSADSSTSSVFFLPKTTSKFLEPSPLKLILRDIWNRGVILGGRSTWGILSDRPVWHVSEADHMYAKCPPVCHLASTHNHLLHPLMGMHCSIVTHHLTLQAVKQTENHHHHHHRLKNFVCIKLNVEEDEAHARKKSRYEGSCSLNFTRSSWICVVMILSS